METSLLLAKLIGLTLLIFGICVLLGMERMRRIGRTFLDSEALMFLSGIIVLPVGLAIIIGHNVWVADWRVLITIIGWIVTLVGIARMFMTSTIQSVGKTVLEKPVVIAIAATVLALVGGYLAYRGFA